MSAFNANTEERNTEGHSASSNTPSSWFALLHCIQCQNSLFTEADFRKNDITGSTVVCPHCQTTYPLAYNLEGRPQPDLRPQISANIKESEQSPVVSDDTATWQHQIKEKLRQYPGFYRFLVQTIGVALLPEPSSQTFIEQFSPEAHILSVGAGVLRRQHPGLIHLDYTPYSHLEIVGDAQQLPFVDNSLDAIVCESMLEHVANPTQVIAEMQRVLKPGGKIYVLMPFMFQFHAAPHDYTRFTHMGLLHQFKGFDTESLTVLAGPASALTAVLVEFLSIICSLGSIALYRLFTMVWMVLLSPLKFLDYVLRHHPEACRSACVFLYIGVKK
ncbi:MAG: class I SAM-dependent methyltransferase [Cyanobacteria bacterium]|nr:class I SAM-dependent methyltransferase [Cyanobacteriota bacterium]